MACLVLSHYMALRWAERDGAEDFVIFEDDVVLPEDFLTKLEQVKKHCPKDTLAVWLEYCCCQANGAKKAGSRALLWEPSVYRCCVVQERGDSDSFEGDSTRPRSGRHPD